MKLALVLEKHKYKDSQLPAPAVYAVIYPLHDVIHSSLIQFSQGHLLSAYCVLCPALVLGRVS